MLMSWPSLDLYYCSSISECMISVSFPLHLYTSSRTRIDDLFCLFHHVKNARLGWDLNDGFAWWELNYELLLMSKTLCFALCFDFLGLYSGGFRTNEIRRSKQDRDSEE
jgi:hypothetical protein